jgi:hypothetical protein
MSKTLYLIFEGVAETKNKKFYNFDSVPFGRLRVARIPHFQIQSPYGVASAPSLKPDQAESDKRASLFCVEFTDEERMFDDVTKVDQLSFRRNDVKWI